MKASCSRRCRAIDSSYSANLAAQARLSTARIRCGTQRLHPYTSIFMHVDIRAHLCKGSCRGPKSCNHFPGYLQKCEVFRRFGVGFRHPGKRRTPSPQVVWPASPVHISEGAIIPACKNSPRIFSEATRGLSSRFMPYAAWRIMSFTGPLHGALRAEALYLGARATIWAVSTLVVEPFSKGLLLRRAARP